MFNATKFPTQRGFLNFLDSAHTLVNIESKMIFLKRNRKKLSVLVFIVSLIYFLSFYVSKVERLSAWTSPAKKERSDGPTIDMINDYYPFVDFKFAAPKISPTVGAMPNVFMIVLVLSGAKGDKFRNRREVIRQTWGNQSNCEQRKALLDERLKDLRWLLVFVVGKAGPGTNDDELNMAEARRHNDMLIGDIEDSYINLILKVYMGLVWASKFDVKYIMKADDDVYVRIPRVLEYLANAKFPRPFYGGLTYPRSKVHRKIGVKWTISYKYYSETYFPDFNHGPFYILSSDLLDKLFSYVYIRKPFHLEDVYVALAMHDSNIKTTNIESFQLSSLMPSYILQGNIQNCEMLSWIAFGHFMDAQAIEELHHRLQSLVCRKIKLDIDYHHCNKIAVAYHWMRSLILGKVML